MSKVSAKDEVHDMFVPMLQAQGTKESVISLFRLMPQEHLMFYFGLITLTIM